MKEEQLQELDMALRAASPEPWWANPQHESQTWSHIKNGANGSVISGALNADAALIVLLRNAAPSLISELREARRLLGEARGAMESGMHLLRFQHVPREEVIAVLHRGLVNSAPGKPAAGPSE